jgi:hypothetical protein
MRLLLRFIRLIVVAAAIYFIVTWSFEAASALSTPNYGLDEATRAQGVRALAQLLGLDPGNTVRLAAFLAAFKLATVAAFALDLVLRAYRRPETDANHGVLEGALLLVVILTSATAITAVQDGDSALIRRCAIDFLIAGVASILIVVERLADVPLIARRDAARLRR